MIRPLLDAATSPIVTGLHQGAPLVPSRGLPMYIGQLAAARQRSTRWLRNYITRLSGSPSQIAGAFQQLVWKMPKSTSHILFAPSRIRTLQMPTRGLGRMKRWPCSFSTCFAPIPTRDVVLHLNHRLRSRTNCKLAFIEAELTILKMRLGGRSSKQRRRIVPLALYLLT